MQLFSDSGCPVDVPDTDVIGEVLRLSPADLGAIDMTHVSTGWTRSWGNVGILYYRPGYRPAPVRHWTCGGCGTVQSRDINAARNILAEGRKIAAGQAETENGCGGTVRPRLALAGPVEAATRRGAA